MLSFTNGIAGYEQLTNRGEMSTEEKAVAITELLRNVHPGQSTGLLVVMTLLPFALMFLSYVLYKKYYTLDEGEYEHICTVIRARKAVGAE